MPVAIINVTIVRAPAINVAITRAPVVTVSVVYPGRVVSGGGGSLPPPTNGQHVIFKPVAGKMFVYNETTSDYQELIALRQSGVDRLTLSLTHYAFADLPAA